MPVYSSAEPNGSYSYGHPYTVVDRSIQVPAGSVVTALGAYMPVPATITISLAAEVSAAPVHVASSVYSFPAQITVDHPGIVNGTGWADFLLPAAYTTTEINSCSVYSIGPAPHNVVLNGNGSWFTGNATGNNVGGFTDEPVNVVPCRVTVGGAPPPPPPPPPTGLIEVPVFGIIRNLGGGAWDVLQADGHKPKNISLSPEAIYVDPTTLALVIPFVKTFPDVGSLVISSHAAAAGNIPWSIGYSILGQYNLPDVRFWIYNSSGTVVNPNSVVPIGHVLMLQGWMWDSPLS